MIIKPALSDWLAAQSINFVGVTLSVMGVYAVLIIYTRISGVRSFSKMSGFDFAVTVAIGSVFAAIITTKNPPLLLGLFILGVLFAVQMLFAWVRSRVPAITAVTDNAPRLIMAGADIQHDQLKAAKMTVSDLKAKLREANVLSLNHVACVIAETTGDVSVLHADHENPDVEMELLEGVIGAERLKP